MARGVVQVGVAHAAELHVNEDIIWADRAALHLGRLEVALGPGAGHAEDINRPGDLLVLPVRGQRDRQPAHSTAAQRMQQQRRTTSASSRSAKIHSSSAAQSTRPQPQATQHTAAVVTARQTEPPNTRGHYGSTRCEITANEVSLTIHSSQGFLPGRPPTWKTRPTLAWPLRLARGW